MTTLDKTIQPQASGRAKVWHRVPVLLRALILGFLSTIIGVFGVPIIASFFPGNWQLVAMGVLLWVYWKFFSGSWGLKSSKLTRRKYSRVGTMAPAVKKWSAAAVVLIVVVFQSSLVVTFRLIEFPAAAFTAEYAFDTMPVLVAWIAIVLAALMAGICEEVGFRGYSQVPLEVRYGPAIAIFITSVVFVAAHLHQAWSPSILLHLFGGGILFAVLAYTCGSLIPGIIAHTILDIFNFSYWWSDVAGKFEYPIIANSGIDLHFIFWLLLLLASTGLSLWAMFKANAARKQTILAQGA